MVSGGVGNFVDHRGGSVCGGGGVGGSGVNGVMDKRSSVHSVMSDGVGKNSVVGQAVVGDGMGDDTVMGQAVVGNRVGNNTVVSNNAVVGKAVVGKAVVGDRDDSGVADSHRLVGSDGRLDLSQTLAVVHLVDGGVCGAECLGLDEAALPPAVAAGDGLVGGLAAAVSSSQNLCGRGGAGSSQQGRDTHESLEKLTLVHFII